MSHSPLVTYTKLSPNCTKPRRKAIDTVTIHCFVGQVTAEQGCNAKRFLTYDSKNGASCNYVVGKDGSVGLCVEEENRSWCSSNGDNDHRSVTIEVASDTAHPYAVTPAAYEALIGLLEDICRRNHIPKLVWSAQKEERVAHKNGCNMTVHRDFKNKACPGQYLYDRHGDIAQEVNRRLAGESAAADTGETAPQTGKGETAKSRSAALAGTYYVTASALRVRAGAGTDKEILGTVKKGTAVKCYGYYTQVGTVQWLYATAGTLTGFFSGEFLAKST